MAVPFATAIPAIVVYHVHREGAIARVRVHIGTTTNACVGELALRFTEFRVWRASLRDYDPARFSLWYADGVYEWLHSNAEAVA